jgi:hypothetical protein
VVRHISIKKVAIMTLVRSVRQQKTSQFMNSIVVELNNVKSGTKSEKVLFSKSSP